MQGSENVFMNRVRIFFEHYAHHLSAIAFLLGFLLDNLALPPVDNPLAHLVIALYLICAGVMITLIQIGERGTNSSGIFSRILVVLPPLIQFIFGGLFSALFVFYARSASLFGAWPFMLLLVLMIVGNEVFRDRYSRLPFQISALFVTLFGFMIFYLPITFHRIDDYTFLLSGVVSVLIVTLFCVVLVTIAPSVMLRSLSRTALAVLGFFLVINVLYFTNSIPPIPLALRTAHIAHAVVRDGAGNYVLTVEEQSWYGKHIALSPPHYFRVNEPIYFYSAIYAPTALRIPLLHEWQYFDEQKGEWVTVLDVTFPIIGGRENGYRSYSLKNATSPGRYRVLVKTARGQVLGKTAFTLVLTEAPVAVEEKVF